jgi:hypothetical protein
VSTRRLLDEVGVIASISPLYSTFSNNFHASLNPRSRDVSAAFELWALPAAYVPAVNATAADSRTVAGGREDPVVCGRRGSFSVGGSTRAGSRGDARRGPSDFGKYWLKPVSAAMSRCLAISDPAPGQGFVAVLRSAARALLAVLSVCESPTTYRHGQTRDVSARRNDPAAM